MLAGVPLGHLADRWGPRRTTVVLALATATALAGFLAVRSYPLFLLVACLYAICQGGLAAARQALLAGLVDPAQRTAVRASLQATLNAGLAVGAGLGALALTVDTAPAYLGVFAAGQRRVPGRRGGAAPAARGDPPGRPGAVRRPPAWPCCGTGRTPC